MIRLILLSCMLGCATPTQHLVTDGNCIVEEIECGYHITSESGCEWWFEDDK